MFAQEERKKKKSEFLPRSGNCYLQFKQRHLDSDRSRDLQFVRSKFTADLRANFIPSLNIHARRLRLKMPAIGRDRWTNVSSEGRYAIRSWNSSPMLLRRNIRSDLERKGKEWNRSATDILFLFSSKHKLTGRGEFHNTFACSTSFVTSRASRPCVNRMNSRESICIITLPSR